MDQIQELTEINWIAFVITLFVIMFAIKEIIEICSYFKKKFRIKTGIQEDKDTIENRISKLEEHDKWSYDEIGKISKGIDDIKDRLDKRDEEDRQRVITRYGADLYNLHDKFMSQGYVTRPGLETFQGLADTYLSYGGNHLIKEKIIPEVYALEVRGGAYGMDE
jgi:hypothetical protein